MKRITKNIIHFTIIGLMLVLILVPALFDKPPDMQNNAMQNQQQMQGSGNKALPDKQNGNDNMQTPPDKPSGDDSQTPPEKPNGEEPPDMQNNQNQNGMQGGAPSGMQPPQQMDERIDIFETLVYVLEFLILTIFLVYVIMSKANKYTYAETFSTNKRKAIFGISVAVITIAGVLIMNLPFEKPGSEPGQMEQPGMSNQTNIESLTVTFVPSLSLLLFCIEPPKLNIAFAPFASVLIVAPSIFSVAPLFASIPALVP